MKPTDLFKVIEQFNQLLGNKEYFTQQHSIKLISQLDGVTKELKGTQIGDEFDPILEALVNKGKKVIEEIKIQKENHKDNNSRAKMYIRYLKSANGDFRGLSIKAIQKYFRAFLLTSVLFLMLSPMYFGFVLPALMFVPIFLGVRGLKNRSFAGFQLSALVVPVGMMTGVIWLPQGMSVANDPALAIANFTAQTGYTGTVATAFAVVPPILGTVLLVSGALMILFGLKARHYFI